MYCKDCAYWGTDEKTYDNSRSMGLKICANIPAFWDSTTWDKLAGDRIFTDKAKDKKAFSQDGSDYMSWVYTKEDFGCVQFKPKPKPKPKTME